MSDNYESLSDRDLDKLVAEKIMGWHKEYMFPADRVGPDRGDLVWRTAGLDSRLYGRSLRGMDGYHQLVESYHPTFCEEQFEQGWEPTTDANCRDQVIEKMRELGFRVGIDNKGPDGW